MLTLVQILGATAYSLNQCIAAMVIGGFGTGMSLVNYPGLAEILPNKYRAIGFAWTEANLILMSIFGSLAGHALAKNATWRWVSYSSPSDIRSIVTTLDLHSRGHLRNHLPRRHGNLLLATISS